MLGKVEDKERTAEGKMVGWHHWLDGCEFEWTPGVGDGQGGLACCDSWGHKESDTTERLNIRWAEPPKDKNLKNASSFYITWSLWLRKSYITGYWWCSLTHKTRLAPLSQGNLSWVHIEAQLMKWALYLALCFCHFPATTQLGETDIEITIQSVSLRG